MIAIDINMNKVESDGTAFYRLPKELKEFFDKVQKDHDIIGFDYDPESPWNFGIIIKKKVINK